MIRRLNLLLAMFFVATIPMQAAEKLPATSARVKIIETKSFDRNQWIANTSNRNYQWSKFLEKYDLIGMTKAQMIEHLGEPIWNKLNPVEDKSLVDYPPTPAAKPGTIGTYFLYSDACGHTAKSIQIRLSSNDRVIAWRVYGMHEPDNWCTKNIGGNQSR